MNRLVIALAWVIHWLPHPFGVSSIGATALYTALIFGLHALARARGTARTVAA